MDLQRLLLLCLWLPCVLGIYVPLREYSGQSFFDGWDYYGNVDNTTWGNVTYVDEMTAMNQDLTFVNGNGHAIIRVDNTTNIANAPLVNRNTIKITSKDAYPIGSLILIDTYHIPYGCSVWPSFWTLGINAEWPQAGEIDVIEAINNLQQNQMALHTVPGCNLQVNTDSGQTGRTVDTDCSTGTGCLVQETKPNSFGSGFANTGGGVFALQMDVSGIYMWFWSRPDVPPSIAGANSTSTLDLSDWGAPSAAYPAAGCDISKYFQAQQLVIDTTLCGDWAGVPDIYASTCPNTCISNVIGNGNPVYNNAYWDIGYVRTYTASSLPPGSVNTGGPNPTSSSPSSSSSSPTEIAKPGTAEGSNTASVTDGSTEPEPTDTNSSTSFFVGRSHETFLGSQGLGLFILCSIIVFFLL
ncbi:hypothetical protein K435DRAFT_783462 [Dendrothele bispora CBS 962.96]|uniref:GH16 domain-containing protein n=1 Tax=Dendrothele bispora (strain CBS 962.96) TaxID=1314807 RepID=A0A4S8L8M4_DENBC|nr:hypothetical protein K435DRAFT_783462 [Dendrothele bispora CBS 962.96]